MAYHKRFEDTYLDSESEEFDGDNKTDGEKAVAIMRKQNPTPKDEELLKKLIERMFVGAKLPGIPGERAVTGLQSVAGEYAKLDKVDISISLWERIADIAGEIGNKDLYFTAMDEIANLS